MDEALAIRFENLGDNCEFGFVQRYYGREPLDLLRWAGSSLPGLIRAFEAEFAELYRLEDLRPVTPNLVCDVKYDLRFHTALPIRPLDGGGFEFVQSGGALIEAHRKERRRIDFLRDKFLDTLAADEKIYVFKANAGVGGDDLTALHRAISRGGLRRLLALVTADAAHPDGVVRLLAPGLKIAGVYRLADYGHAEDAPFEAWSAICETAAATPWDAAETAVPVRPWAPAPMAALTVVQRQVLSGVYGGLFGRRPDNDAQDYLHTLQDRGLEAGLTDVLQHCLQSKEFKTRP